MSISAASREFGIDRKRIREWIKHREKLQLFTKSGKTKRKRLTGGGRKANDEDMEDSLFGWIVDLRSHNLRISRDVIVCQEKTLSTDPSFKASLGWLRAFMKRKELPLRRRTTVCQNTPVAHIEKLVQFVMHLRQLQTIHQFHPNSVYAMDETACWMDMPGDTTVHFSGVRSVSVKSTGHDKNHYTVVLTAKADGTKMKPFIVFKGKGTRLMKDLSLKRRPPV